MDAQQAPPIFIVSGGVGASAEQVVNTVLAQFPERQVPVVTIKHTRTAEQVEQAVARAQVAGGILVHTLVDGTMRARLTAVAAQAGVPAIDLMGPLLTQLTAVLQQQPLGQPGLYRQLHHTYFERVAAIEYTMMHDDGKRPNEWGEADIVLAGVSRTGKTPLSIYLSVLGWKVANVPLVPETAVAPQLFQLNPARVVGLTITLERLLTFRRQRSSQMGISRTLPYADPTRIAEELEFAQRIYRRGKFAVLDVTDKTVEASANEIVRLVDTRRALWET